MQKTWIILFFVFGISGCVSSNFRIEEDQNKDKVFQYCAGQIWGYFQTVYDLKGPVKTRVTNRGYTAEYMVFLSIMPQDPEDQISFNFILDSKSPKTELIFKEKSIKIVNGQIPVDMESAPLLVTKKTKYISERFPIDQFKIKAVPKEPNKWLVGKYLFGSKILTEKPQQVVIPYEVTDVVDFDDVKVPFDPAIYRGVYIRSFIPLQLPRSDEDVRLEVILPEFKINGKKVPQNTYVFNYNRNKILAALSEYDGTCPTIEQVFQWR